jgi:uncharacterized protein (TIGR03435 family)
MRCGYRLLVFTSALSAGLVAQEGRPAFEVASVKPGRPLGPLGKRYEASGGPGSDDPGLYACHNCPLTMFIMRAYGLNAAHPFSAPPWMDDQRFDLQAKMPADTTQEQFSLMMRDLLEERFKLVVHHEQRETPVYYLVIAKNGPKFKESAPYDAANEPPAAIGPSQPLRRDKDGIPVIPPGSGIEIAMANGHSRLRLDKETTLRFAELIGGPLQRPVIDATGLKGKYDFMLSWVPELPRGAAADSNSGPTLQDAIQAQLGLRLESKKAMVDVLVIDRAEKVPTGN